MTMLGVDVSNHQREIDWAAVASAGIQYALIKATEGVDYADPWFTRNVAGARAAGLLVGAYHYGRVENSPGREAVYFCQHVLDELQPGDLVALDIEETTPDADVAAWSLAWLEMVREGTNCRALVYSYPDFITHHLTDPALAAFPLWLASWQAGNPTVPGPWTDYAIWQFQSTGTVSGINGHADVNRTELDMDALKALGLPDTSPTYNVGPGVLSAMERAGDSPISDENYFVDGLSVTAGNQGLYLYHAASDMVAKAPRA